MRKSARSAPNDRPSRLPTAACSNVHFQMCAHCAKPEAIDYEYSAISWNGHTEHSLEGPSCGWPRAPNVSRQLRSSRKRGHTRRSRNVIFSLHSPSPRKLRHRKDASRTFKITTRVATVYLDTPLNHTPTSINMSKLGSPLINWILRGTSCLRFACATDTDSGLQASRHSSAS